MSDLDSLIGYSISLITQENVRYDGILFSINAREASIVLRDGIRKLELENHSIYLDHIFFSI